MSAVGELRLSVDGPDGGDGSAELRSLQQWLSSDDALRGRVRGSFAPPRPGQMGASVDVLTILLGTGGVAGLVAPLCSWITSRRSDVTVSLESGDGRKVSLDIKRAADPEAVIRRAQELFDPADGQGE
ncbi:effector-associated constant component EACC1 [Streptomyces luteolus]|uniref:Uncharacterized protein n=1 Tax=Streptomyces luteolus TaxID=3043615 RepID=A0ABT6T2M5_9ACTN|nr:hypothetical protein [Streptomyces sp. B-S-A12]MDI3421660.1 hypothetical protein [Streptomyces sp. B-S-A12]